MHRAVVLAALAVLTLPAGASAAPTAEALAAACTARPIHMAFGPSEGNKLRTVAACVLRELREDLGLRTRIDVRVRRRAVAALDVATRRKRSTRTARDEVARTLARGACPSGRGAHVRFAAADSSQRGSAATPVQVAAFVRRRAQRTGRAALLRARTRTAVVVRPGRPFHGERTGAIAVLLAGVDCG